MQWGQAVGQLLAAHLGHHHIGDHEVDGPRVPLTDQQGLAPVPGLHNVIPIEAKKPNQQSPECVFIFHHQNGFGAFQLGRQGNPGPRGLHRCLDARQIDLERGALSGVALHVNATAVLFDNPIDHGQPQPGTFAHLFRGEERLEDVIQGLCIHTAAGVGHCQPDVAPRRDILKAALMVGGKIDIICRQDKPAAGGHGIPGVDRQVHDDLAYLAGVGLHRPQIGAGHDVHLDVFADETPQHLFQIGHHPVEVEHLRLRHLPAAEGQQLLGQRRGPFGGFEDIFAILIEGVVFNQAGPDELAVTHDGH